MKTNFFKVFFFCFFFLQLSAALYSQNTSLTDLQNQYVNCKIDTEKVNILLKISGAIANYDTSMDYANKALGIAIKNDFKKGIATSYKRIGICFLYKGDNIKSIDYFSKAIKYYDEIGDKVQTGKCYNNIGICYFNQSNFTKALEYNYKGLKLFEEINDKKMIALGYTNIGNINYTQNNFPKALEYFSKSLSLCEKLNDSIGMAKDYINMGLIYIDKKDYPRAFEYEFKALKIYEKTGDKIGISSCYVNIATLYSETSDYKMAVQYYKNGLKIKEEIGDSQGLAVCYVNLGNIINNKLKEYKSAIEYSLKGIKISKEINDLDNLRFGYQNLAASYEDLHDYKNAYEYERKFKELTDSVFNIENSKQMSDLKTNYEVQKKEDELNAKANAEKEKLAAITEAEKKRQRTIIYFIIFILIIVSIASVFLWNRYKVTERQKNIIEKQKDVVQIQKQKVEEKNKEILDSIQYAKRLQNAILPKSKLVKEYLADSFIFFRPKDIVAGDFYWVYPIKNKKEETVILFAAADCTGHGVPGAMVSVVCANALNRAVKEMGLRDPGKILDAVSQFVIETFVQKDMSGTSTENEVSDGMDISLGALNLATLQFEWSGANNPLIVIKKSNEIIEIKPDKQPVGLYENPHPFTTHSLDLEKGAMIYLFSDGYADQFGGERGRKLMKANFIKHLQNISGLNVDMQFAETEKHFENWKGDQQQIDDICVIGVRV